VDNKQELICLLFSPFIATSRLHDFGFRGCTCVEQAVVGGTSHLLSFRGSDTVPACFYVQSVLNDGIPVGNSIPASEHSVMMAHTDERAAILHLMGQYLGDGDGSGGIFACVMDSFDYEAALSQVLPSVASTKVAKGGFLVLRPDSGDPTLVVMQALQ
jgi:nicotinamide phosphoribosyltransferase